jgi:alpha-mannosidase
MSLVRGAIHPDLLADEGGQRFTYSFYPHGGELIASGVREEAEALNQPLLHRWASGLAESEIRPLRFQGAPAALSALKSAEDGAGLIPRVYEPYGSRGPFSVATPPSWRLDGPLNLMEEFFARSGPEDLMPFEVRSWRLTKEA